MTSLPAITRLPKDASKDLSALTDRQQQLAIINSYQNRSIRSGMLVILAFFGGLVGWAAVAPLSGAIIASGEIKVEGRNKPVQHATGGVISEVLVKDGQLVEQGQVLLRLDRTREGATAETSDKRYLAVLALEARLLAERDGRADMALPEELVSRQGDLEVAMLVDAQKKVFEARREAKQGTLTILEQRVEQLHEEIKGLKAQLVSTGQQLGLVKEEVGMVSYLFKQGLTSKPRLLALERQQAALIGQKGNLEAAIARAQQRIGETEQQRENVRSDFYSRVVDELRGAQVQLKELREQRTVATFLNQRMEVLAPITGYVQAMDVVGVNQVVGAGQVLMEIVPRDKPLIAEIRLRPDNIDEVKLGMTAEVKLDIYNARTFIKKIDGRVIFIAADKSDPKTGVEYAAFPRGYYRARVEIDKDQIAEYHKTDNIALIPGAPTTVIIPTIERTALQYLVAPLLQGFDEAFREP